MHDLCVLNAMTSWSNRFCGSYGFSYLNSRIWERTEFVIRDRKTSNNVIWLDHRNFTEMPWTQTSFAEMQQLVWLVKFFYHWLNGSACGGSSNNRSATQFHIIVFLFCFGVRFIFVEDNSRLWQWPSIANFLASYAKEDLYDSTFNLWVFGALSKKPLHFKGTWRGLPFVRTGWLYNFV